MDDFVKLQIVHFLFNGQEQLGFQRIHHTALDTLNEVFLALLEELGEWAWDG